MADAACIRSLYETYIETVETLERNRKPGDGLLGIKKGPADDPCHDRFAEELAKAIEEYAAQEPPPAELADTLSFICSVPLEHRDPRSVYWMLVAVQGLSVPLIGGLEPADAASLHKAYAAAYPRWERLPVQKKVLSALREKSGRA